MSNTRILPWVVLIGLVAFTAATYAGLPAEIAMKISAQGVITHTTEKSLFNWFLLVGIAALTQAFLTWLTVLLPKQPELFNFSAKERLLALPREYQGPVVERMQFAMDIIGVLMMLLLCYVQFMLWRTSLGNHHTLGFAAIVVFTAVFTPAILLLVGRVSAEVEVQEKRCRAAGHWPVSPVSPVSRVTGR